MLSNVEIKDSIHDHILEIKLRADGKDWSITDFLEATVEEALPFLFGLVHLPASGRALTRLKLLQDVGLGYPRLGQPINTLSGGESQRLKLASHLAEAVAKSRIRSPASEKPVRVRALQSAGRGFP